MIDTKALREKILNLAMTGKLVSQYPSDKPISELLKDLEIQKDELIKQKKIKRDKNETKIFSDENEIYYEEDTDGMQKKIDVSGVPKGWSLVRLPKLVKLENGSIKRGPFGSSIKKSMFVPYTVDTYKVYEQGNAIRHTYEYGTYYLNKSDYEDLEGFSVKPRDIIISCAGTIGKFYVIPEDAPEGVINQALLRLRINEQIIDMRFFLLAFQRQVDKLNNDAAGSAMKNLGAVKYLKKELLWFLPPFEEQKRIVAKIEELFNLLDIIEHESAAYKVISKQLESKVFDLAMQGKLVAQNPDDDPLNVLLKKEHSLSKITEKQIPFEIPNSWEWVRLKSILHPQINSKPKGSQFTYIDISAIDNRNNKIMSVPMMQTEKAPSRATKLIEKNDILFSMVRPYLKNIAFVDAKCDNTIGSSGIYVMKPNHRFLFNKYLFFVTLSSYMIHGTTKLMRGDNSPSIKKTDVDNFLIPLPPINEQKRIVEKLELLFEAMDL